MEQNKKELAAKIITAIIVMVVIAPFMLLLGWHLLSTVFALPTINFWTAFKLTCGIYLLKNTLKLL